MKPRLWQLLAVVCSFAALGVACARTRTALVGQGNGGGENVLDMATALLSKDTGLELLDRTEVDRVLREQKFSPGGIVDAEHAVSAGRLLQADLFAVLEGTLTNETGGTASFGLVVFDAKTGARYFDSALSASNTVSAAAATAAAVRAAVAKSRLNAEVLHTVGVLRVRNADLPRQLDSLCDSVGLLLERELAASPGIAVLERRRLEQVNKERSLAPDAEGNRLLASVRMIELDIARDGEGLRGTLALVGVDGTRTNGITASVPTRSAADLAHLLADKTERFLQVPVEGSPVDRRAEADRFHREYSLLARQRDDVMAVRALDAAQALAPEQTGWRREMANLLPNAVIDIINLDHQNFQTFTPIQVVPADLASCLALCQREADLLLDLAREAAGSFKPGEPFPEEFTRANPVRLIQLLQQLADVQISDPASAAEVVALAGKERTLRMEVLEPFLVKQAVDGASFSNCCRVLVQWFSPGHARSRQGVSMLSKERAQDDALALKHWVELSHKLNPPDGSGNYAALQGLEFFSRYRENQVEEFRKSLEEDQDLVIRTYARAGRVASLPEPPGGMISDDALAAEREFRLYAQELLTHGEAAKPGPLREHVWQDIKSALHVVLNHKESGTEFLDACRFAFAQGDIEVDLFYSAISHLENPFNRKLPEELEVVDGALKLILEKPEAFPVPLYPGSRKRNDVIKDFQQKHDRLAGQIAGAAALAPGSQTADKKVCLLDLKTPTNHLGCLFQPVVQDGQVYAAALGFQQWGLTEDTLQLVRVPLAGGPAEFLGRAAITVADLSASTVALLRRPGSPVPFRPSWLDVGRCACFGGGNYCLATGSGLFVFPTNGGPVVRLGASNNLPTDDTHAVAFLDGRFYIAAGDQRGGYLAAYEPESHAVTILASTRRAEHLSPFDDQPPFCAQGLVADPMRHRLIMAVSGAFHTDGGLAPITPLMGIWSYQPSTGEFKRLAPLRLLERRSFDLRLFTWTGLVGADTVAIKDSFLMALFDLRTDHVVSIFDDVASKETNGATSFWLRPLAGASHQLRLADGPFMIRGGWFYSTRPAFERMAMADGRREAIPSVRTDYDFKPVECLKALPDQRHILAADQCSIWLLELDDESAQSSDEKAGAGSTSIKE